MPMPVLPGGALDDYAAGLELSLLLGVLDDRERGTVLHRAAGIEELGLAVDIAARRCRSGLELDQRRVANAVDESRPDVHVTLSLRPCARSRKDGSAKRRA